MISTVTYRGRSNWMIIDGAFNHERRIEFLDALRRDGRRRRKKVFLILDNLGVHHCKPEVWLTEHPADIEVFFLPSYIPKLNPDERLPADLKQAIETKVPVRTKAKLRTAADEHMHFVAADRDRVRAYFQDPIVRYAERRLHRAGSIGHSAPAPFVGSSSKSTFARLMLAYHFSC